MASVCFCSQVTLPLQAAQSSPCKQVGVDQRRLQAGTPQRPRWLALARGAPFAHHCCQSSRTHAPRPLAAAFPRPLRPAGRACFPALLLIPVATTSSALQRPHRCVPSSMRPLPCCSQITGANTWCARSRQLERQERQHRLLHCRPSHLPVMSSATLPLPLHSLSLTHMARWPRGQMGRKARRRVGAGAEGTSAEPHRSDRGQQQPLPTHQGKN